MRVGEIAVFLGRFIRGVEREGLVELLDGFGRLIHAEEQLSEVVVDLCIGGIGGRERGEVLRGFVELAGFDEARARL